VRKSLIAFLLLPVFVLGIVMYASAGDEPWFDMKSCEMCKPILEEDPALMENMTWEHHNISNGLVSVSTVAPAYMAHFKKAEKGMMAVQERLQQGTDVKLCNMCVAMSDMLKTGKVKSEQVETMNGSVSLMTSDDPKMVDRIQKWGERTNDEMVKMEKTTEALEMSKMGGSH
jgi:hypothetical protein